jgi:hypothetical protein
MIRTRLLEVILICLMIAGTSDRGYANRVGGDAYPFLKVGVGARALGMGGAFVSLADDGTAPYWNPAGLGLEANQEKRRIDFMGAFWGRDEFDRSHTYFSAVYPKLPLPWLASSGTWALSAIHMGVSQIPLTADDGSGGLLQLGDFDDSQWAWNLSYGRSVFPSQGRPMFYVGGSTRYLSHSMGFDGGGSGWGWGLDFGIIGDVNIIFRKQNEALLRFLHNVKMGLLFQKNFDLKWDTGHKDDDPASGILGLSFEPILNDLFRYTFAMDFHRTEAQPFWISLGNEIALKNLGENSLAIRFGLSKYYLKGAGGGLDRTELNQNRLLTFGIGAGIGQLQTVKVVIDVGYTTGRLEDRARTSLSVLF